MSLTKEKAQKASFAADAIGNAMVKTLSDMRPTFARTYQLDDQLVTLAIAQAATGIAAAAASEATGMVPEECLEIETRLHAVLHDAMNELLVDR